MQVYVIFFIILSFANIVLASTPKQIKQTNITSTSFTISWITDVRCSGKIVYGSSTDRMIYEAFDDRGENTIDDTHHVTVYGLYDNTTYYYDIVSDNVVYDNAGKHYSITTGRVLDVPADSDFVYGEVYTEDGTIAVGAICYIKICDFDNQGSSGNSAERSCIVDKYGRWSENLVNFRTQTLDDFFEYSLSGDKLHIFIQGASRGIGKLIVDTNNDSPAPSITISTDIIPPGKITTLQVVSSDLTCVKLSWTAPGDDKYEGRATRYEIRYSTMTITTSNWYNATVVVEGVPVPEPAGTLQYVTISGLLPDTTYSFCIRTRDEVQANWSEISNVVTGSTKQQSKPVLQWLGKPNLVRDGLRTEIAEIGMNIVYQVLYKDRDGKPPLPGYPKIGIYKQGVLLGTYTMLYASGEYSTGAIYTFSMIFNTPGIYAYQFDGGNVELTGAHLCMDRQMPVSATCGPVIYEHLDTHRVSNITDCSFNVSWVTTQPVKSKIIYGTSTDNITTVVEDLLISNIHYVTIDNLLKNTTYYYDIMNDTILDDNNGNHYQITLPSALDISSGSDLIYGKIYDKNYNPAANTVVYVWLCDNDGTGSSGYSSTGATRVDTEGGWSIELRNLRTANLNELFVYSLANDLLYILVNGADAGMASEILMTDEDTPVCELSLCDDYIPPGKITGLSVRTTSPDAITLQWIASGDDGYTGCASYYHIRYATSSDKVIDIGIEVSGEPTPAMSGTLQEFMITGLCPETIYYFVIQASDEMWNTSEVSDIVVGTTAPMPKHKPVLSWMNEKGYINDGVNPNIANIYTKFIYKIRYTDIDDNPPIEGQPQVIIYHNNNIIGKYSMEYVSGKFTTSAIYTCSVELPLPGTYSYQFVATDVTGEYATGIPVDIHPGPYVIGIPKNIRITNITDTGFTVSWVSKDKATGYIRYGTSSVLLNRIGYDIRGETVEDNIHYVTVTNLTNNTVYYFDVITGEVEDDNNGEHYMVKTGNPIIPAGSKLICGRVCEKKDIPAKDVIVYVNIIDDTGKSSAIMSALTDTEGIWYVNLVNIRTRDNLSLFTFSDNSIVNIYAEGGYRGCGAKQVLATTELVPDIILYQPVSGLFIKDKTYSYPNPAKQVNSIFFRYCLDADAKVTLKIYNLVGELITQMETYGIGYNIGEIKWDISDVAPDVYIWQIIAENETEQDMVIKKLVIIK